MQKAMYLSLIHIYSWSGLTRGRSLLLVDLDHMHVQKFHINLAPNSIQLKWVTCIVFRKMYRIRKCTKRFRGFVKYFNCQAVVNNLIAFWCLFQVY